MKRTITLIMAALTLCMQAGAQEVVIDPTQIAASAINVMDQIDYAIDQITELTDMGGKLGNLKGHLDNVFGEDGVGGKAISLMQDLGTLERLTKVFNSTVSSASRYAAVIKENGNFRVSDVNAMLSYLNTSKQTAQMAVDMAKKILNSIGLSKGEKKAEIDKAIKEMEESLAKMQTSMEIEIDSILMAQGMTEFMDIIDSEGSPENYVEALQGYGQSRTAGGSALGLVTAILMLLGIVSCAYGYVVYMRGGIAGDPTAEKIFIRIGVALFTASFIIGLISNAFNLKL